MAKKEKEVIAHGDKTRLQWTWHLMKQYKIGYVMIAPYVLLFTLITVIPVFSGILVSFTDFNLLQMPNWVGLDNYINLFINDDLFITAVKNTMIFAITVGPGSYILSFVVAWFINELTPKVRAFVTLIFYAPSLCGGIYVVFNYIFSGLLWSFERLANELGHYCHADFVLPRCKNDYAYRYFHRFVDVIGYRVSFLYRRFPGTGPQPIGSGCCGWNYKPLAGALVYHSAQHEAAAFVRRYHVNHQLFRIWRNCDNLVRGYSYGLCRVHAFPPFKRIWYHTVGIWICMCDFHGTFLPDDWIKHAGTEDAFKGG